MDVDQLNTLEREQACPALLQCCGSSRWARMMAAARPFSDCDALMNAADRIWRSLDPADWLEAFAAHPRIGSGADRAIEPAIAGVEGPGLSEPRITRAEG